MTKTNDALDANIDKMLMWNINGHTEPVVFQPEMKAAIKKLIIADRKRLIERLETEAVGEDVPPDVPKRVGKDANGKYLYETKNYSLRSMTINNTNAEIRQRIDIIKQEELNKATEPKERRDEQ